MTRRQQPSLLGAATFGAIVVLAATLRLWGIKHDAQNPFYDAAVRSMGLSWHNFFFGAFDPGGTLAIDKPPVDLWLQVASTKVLGFNRTALALPEALGGTIAVALLYGALAQTFGRLAGALAALSLAVLPISVLTSRSDTMDSVMSALLVGALWSGIVAVRGRRARYALLSAALLGAAFNVKLTQALIPLPALALLWWAASRSKARVAFGAAIGTVLVIVGMAWAFVASLTPLSERPFPIGSGTGSIYKAIFVFNGIDRLTATGRNLAPVGFPSNPGATRLLSMARPDYASLIGLEIVAAVALALAAGLVWAQARTRVTTRAELARALSDHERTENETALWTMGALVVWLAVTYLLFSFIGHLQPRYLEAMSPAIAATIGLCGAYLLHRGSASRAALLCAAALAVNAAFAIWASGTGDLGARLCLLSTAVAVTFLCARPLRTIALGNGASRAAPLRLALIGTVGLALAAAPADASIDLIERRVSDASPSGSGSQYSAYLKAHRGGARYEAAAASTLDAAGLIMQDGQPVLIFRDVDRSLVGVGQLERLVKDGSVRFLILPQPCKSKRHCSPAIAWSMRHAKRVRPGLYRYTLAVS